MKSFSCRDVGYDCDWTTQDDSEERVMEEVEKHARENHGVTDFGFDLKDKMRSFIRDIKAA